MTPNVASKLDRGVVARIKPPLPRNLLDLERVGRFTATTDELNQKAGDWHGGPTTHESLLLSLSFL